MTNHSVANENDAILDARRQLNRLGFEFAYHLLILVALLDHLALLVGDAMLVRDDLADEEGGALEVDELTASGRERGRRQYERVVDETVNQAIHEHEWHNARAEALCRSALFHFLHRFEVILHHHVQVWHVLAINLNTNNNSNNSNNTNDK